MQPWRARLASVLCDVGDPNDWDAAGCVPEPVLERLAATGLLGANISTGHGGLALTMAELGELNRDVAYVSASLQTLLGVHGMAVAALQRWGSASLQAELLPAMATGRQVAAFALTEAGAGSDNRDMLTRLTADGDHFVLDGAKQWISFAQRASVLLVVAQSDRGPVVVVVDADQSGVTVVPSPETMGLRAAALGDIRFDNCVVPAHHVVGRPGFGLSHVATTALTYVRHALAWSALGVAEAALDHTAHHVSTRTQHGVALREHQTVRSSIAREAVSLRGASLLVEAASRSYDANAPQASREVITAKLAATTTALAAADTAVQLHGALGLSDAKPISRFFRDARVMTIIDGSTEVLEDLVGSWAIDDRRAKALPSPVSEDTNA